MMRIDLRTVPFVLSVTLLGVLTNPAWPSATVTSKKAAVHAAKARRFELAKSLKTLQKVREELMKAKSDYGGCRTKAVEGVDSAIDELKLAMLADR
jgi:hypothetical protein